jgi:hypothetical protein
MQVSRDFVRIVDSQPREAVGCNWCSSSYDPVGLSGLAT